jgi:hypothetical protein
MLGNHISCLGALGAVTWGLIFGGVVDWGAERGVSVVEVKTTSWPGGED